MTFNPTITNSALARMRDAHSRGKGVRLSHVELSAFSVELIGQWWASIDESGENVEASKEESDAN